MPSIEQLEKRRENINASISLGVLKVKHGEKETTYRSISEMKAVRADIDRQIQRLSGQRKTTKQHRIAFSRGT